MNPSLIAGEGRTEFTLEGRNLEVEAKCLLLKFLLLACKTSFCTRGEAQIYELAINFLGHSRSGLPADREIGVAKAEFSKGISMIRAYDLPAQRYTELEITSELL